MELFILRHGIAEDTSASGKDRDRVLTTEGRERTAAAGKALRKFEISFDLVLSSPFARAWQTAEIIVDELNCRKLLKSCDALSSGASIHNLLVELRNVCSKYASVLIVGHEPDLSRLLSTLISGSPDLAITMKKGGLAKLTILDLEPVAARLEWLLGPKHLCRMA